MAFFGRDRPDTIGCGLGVKTADTGSRVLSRVDAVRWIDRYQQQGGVVVFTNGVFDLLHPGHVRYLQQARALGDALVVGLNSDDSVRRNKGPERPITPAVERAEILAALECVDVVVIFDEDTPASIIDACHPDILVKGADWPADQIVGRDTVESRGGRVVRIPVEPGQSTSAIISRIRAHD